MRLELAKLHQELATTMIYVTHDQIEAMTLADRVVVLDQGRISQVGTPLDLYHRPENKFVASFIGSPAMNFLPAAVTGTAGREVRLRLAGLDEARFRSRRPLAGGDGRLELGIRPEHIATAAPGAGHLDGEVRMLEHLGHTTILYVETPAGDLIVEDGGESRLRVGDAVGLAFNAERVHLFDANGEAV
jgi:ABC-type sugar transport system ATPase subunit